MSTTKAQQALREIELRTVQARIASGIGRQSSKQQVAFLLGELERIRNVAVIALQAEGGLS